MLTEAIQVGASMSLGLLAGSWLLEALVLAPFWRTMKDEAFLELYAELGGWLYRYFAPLTVVTIVLAALATLLPLFQGDTPNLYRWISLGCILLILAMFAVYFKKSIEGFKQGVVGDAGLAADLATWARWHSVRVALGSTAFVASLLA